MHYNDWHLRQEVAIRCLLLRRRTSLKIVRFLGKLSAFTAWSWTKQGGRSRETLTRARVEMLGYSTAFGNVAALCAEHGNKACVSHDALMPCRRL